MRNVALVATWCVLVAFLAFHSYLMWEPRDTELRQWDALNGDFVCFSAGGDVDCGPKWEVVPPWEWERYRMRPEN